MRFCNHPELICLRASRRPHQIFRAVLHISLETHPPAQSLQPSHTYTAVPILFVSSQVLCNADLRAKYDEHGSKGLDVNFMDGGEFFNMLFGNDLFEHLVGELMMAAAAR